MKTRRGVLKFILLMMIALPGSAATSVDLHRLWDSRCAECHGHSAEFARSFLRVTDGELQGRHHVADLRRFLGYHYTPAYRLEALYQMLAAQAVTPPRYAGQCARCHASAAIFVRKSLQLRDEVLVSRKTGIPVSEFMQNHRSLDAEAIEFFVQLLERVGREVYSR